MSFIELKIAEILSNLGVPMHLDGYHYLRRAAALYSQIGNRPIRMMTDIYAVVADEFGTSARCVERSIRTAVDKAFREGDLNALESFFGRAISSSTGKVTNRRFIAMVAYGVGMGIKRG